MTTNTSTDAVDVGEFDFTYSEGSEAAREAAKSSNIKFDRTEWFGLDASPAGVASGANRCIMRFLSDHVRVEGQPDLIPWITVDQHSMIPTKAAPPKEPGDDKERAWPKAMGAVCRNDKIFKVRYGDCYICTMKKPDGKKYYPGNRTWALGVLREEVLGDGTPEFGGPERKGQVLGVRDKTKEVVVVGEDGKIVEGEVKVVKCYVKVNMGWKNFFGPLSGLAGYYHTVLDRDYHILREGTGPNDTIYTFAPMDPISMADGTMFDVRNPDVRAKYYADAPDLRTFVAEQASTEFYQRFFIPGVFTKAPTGAAAATKTADGPAVVPAAPSSEPSTERLTALKDRIVGYGPAAAAADTSKTEPPAEGTAVTTPAPAAKQGPLAF